jgi:hypothetical protein
MLFNSKNKKKKKRQKNIGWLEKSVTVGASFRSGQTHTRPKEGGGNQSLSQLVWIGNKIFGL